MRYFRISVLVLIGLALFLIAFANRATVELRFVPAELTNLWQGGNAVTLPLFVVILGSVVIGVIIGFIWEWLREHRYRSGLRTNSREVERLRREVDAIKSRPEDQTDEITRLLDKR